MRNSIWQSSDDWSAIPLAKWETMTDEERHRSTLGAKTHYRWVSPSTGEAYIIIIW